MVSHLCNVEAMQMPQMQSAQASRGNMRDKWNGSVEALQRGEAVFIEAVPIPVSIGRRWNSAAGASADSLLSSPIGRDMVETAAVERESIGG